MLQPSNFADILSFDISLDAFDGIAIEIEPINNRAAKMKTSISDITAYV